MPLRPFTAHLARTSPRYQDWLRVFGDSIVPLRSPFAVRASAPGVEGLFYHVLVSALTSEQRQRLVEHLAEKFGEAPGEVERTLDDERHGLPILATDVSVATDLRYVL